MSKEMATKALVSESNKSAEEIIRAGLPDVFFISKVSRISHQGDAFDTFCYDGKPFLELHRPELESGFDGEKYTVRVTQKYRYLSGR